MKLAGQGGTAGYAMAALLVGMSVMAVLMTMALPVWTHMAKREKEEELIWRGQQYARAVGLFQRKYANAYPPTIDLLVEQRFLRKKYKDPITNDDFQPIPAGQMQQRTVTSPSGGAVPGRGTSPITPQAGGAQPSRPGAPSQLNFQPVGQPNIGIAGVVSKSPDSSIKVFNGRTKYNEWAFVYIQTARQITAPGQGQGQGGIPTPFGPGGRGTGPFDPSGRGGRPPVPGQNPGRGFGPSTPFGPPSPFGPPGQPMQPGQRPPQRPPGV